MWTPTLVGMTIWPYTHWLASIVSEARDDSVARPKEIGHADDARTLILLLK